LNIPDAPTLIDLDSEAWTVNNRKNSQLFKNPFIYGGFLAFKLTSGEGAG